MFLSGNNYKQKCLHFQPNPRRVQLVARNRQSRTEVEFPRSVQLVARIKTLKNHRTLFRTDVESFVHQDARYARKNTHKNHRTSFRTEGKSFVHQNTRDNMEKRAVGQM